MLTWLNLKGTSHVSVLSITAIKVTVFHRVAQSTFVLAREMIRWRQRRHMTENYAKTQSLQVSIMPLPSKSMQRNIHMWRNVPYLGWERESETKREWERIREGATYILLNATSSTKKNVSVVIDVCLLCRLVSALHSWVGPFCLRGWRSLPPTT